MRSSGLNPVAAAVLACLSSSALADAHSHFEVQQLEVEGAIKEVVAADLDGDGHEDLLVVFDTGVPPDEQRNFAIFWNQGRDFAGKPDLIVPAPVDACAFDVADIDDQPGDELLLITPTGVTTQSLRGRHWGARAPLVTEPTLFHQPGAGELPRLKIVEDFAGPGSHDLIVPGLGVAALYRRKGTQFELAGRIELTMDGSLTTRGLGRDPGGLPPVSLKYRYPAILVADTDGDGRGDLVASLDDRLAVYRQLDGVTFAPKPTFQRNFAIRTLDELKEASSAAAISVSDIDGDGVADLVVRKEVEHGLASAITTTYVFFGQKGGVYAEKADQIIKSQGASGTAVELIDLTADGHPDLVVPSVNIGVLAIIRILTTKSLRCSRSSPPSDASPTSRPRSGTSSSASRCRAKPTFRRSRSAATTTAIVGPTWPSPPTRTSFPSSRESPASSLSPPTPSRRFPSAPTATPCPWTSITKERATWCCTSRTPRATAETWWFSATAALGEAEGLAPV